MLLLLQKIQHTHQADQWEHRDWIGLLGVLQKKEVRGLNLGTERATEVIVALVGKKVEFMEIIALILDIEEAEVVALAKEGEVDSIVEEVEDLVPSLSTIICKSLLVCGNFSSTFFCVRNLLLLKLLESKHFVVETFLESVFSFMMLSLRVMN
jgi:hypothetical protein